MPDFSALLSKPADEIKKPKPNPAGSYSGIIKKFAFDEAKTPRDTANPTKPVCELAVGLTEPMDDVDAEDYAAWVADGGVLNARDFGYTMWLTPDAQYRVIELATSCGIAVEGKSLGEVIAELPNMPVIASVELVQSKKQGQEEVFFANITNLVGTGS